MLPAGPQGLRPGRSDRDQATRMVHGFVAVLLQTSQASVREMLPTAFCLPFAAWALAVSPIGQVPTFGRRSSPGRAAPPMADAAPQLLEVASAQQHGSHREHGQIAQRRGIGAQHGRERCLAPTPSNDRVTSQYKEASRAMAATGSISCTLCTICSSGVIARRGAAHRRSRYTVTSCIAKAQRHSASTPALNSRRITARMGMPISASMTMCNTDSRTPALRSNPRAPVQRPVGEAGGEPRRHDDAHEKDRLRQLADLVVAMEPAAVTAGGAVCRAPVARRTGHRCQRQGASGLQSASSCSA